MMFLGGLVSFVTTRFSPMAMVRAAVIGLVALLVLLAWNARYAQGKRDAIHAVIEQNAKSGHEANVVKLSVDQCFDKGGEWNVKKGSCDLPQ